MITAAQPYGRLSCPRRVDPDAHGDPSLRVEPGPVVRMLWRRGSTHEATVVAGLPVGAVRQAGLRCDVGKGNALLAMEAAADIIQGGRICADDLLGDPPSTHGASSAIRAAVPASNGDG